MGVCTKLTRIAQEGWGGLANGDKIKGSGMPKYKENVCCRK